MDLNKAQGFTLVEEDMPAPPRPTMEAELKNLRKQVDGILEWKDKANEEIQKLTAQGGSTAAITGGT